MACCGRKFKIVTAVVVAITFMVVGICSVLLCSTLFHQILSKELTLSDHSTSYEMWKETPIPMYMNIYFFNWTNAEEVVRDWSVKPVFEQRGPYVFYEHHVRVNLTWDDDGTVTYQQKRLWRYLPEKSNGTLKDNITSINVIASTVAYLVRNKPYLVKEMINFFMELKENNLILTKTVDEWTFSGYDDKLLEMASQLNISNFKIPYKKFGWFYGRNDSETYDGDFTIYTGAKDIEQLGIVDKWNGLYYTPFYSNNCALINGTSGELWPPVTKRDTIDLFLSDLCSSIMLSYVKSTSEFYGIEGKKFVGKEFNFDNGSVYPEQKCFNDDRVFPSGIRSVSKCRFGAPAFVSYPHFYLADPIYRSSVVGMNPNKSEHELYIIFEPNTGIPLEARAGMQINLLIEPIKGLTMFENVKSTFVPMLWFSQTATLTAPFVDQAKVLLTVPNIFIYTGCGLIVIATLILLAVVYLTRHQVWKSGAEVQNLLEDSS